MCRKDSDSKCSCVSTELSPGCKSALDHPECIRSYCVPASEYHCVVSSTMSEYGTLYSDKPVAVEDV